MFYSHTFLARKGPLGTVWCAAHLQHKLKKSHYTATDIPSTVGSYSSFSLFCVWVDAGRIEQYIDVS
ncbi:Sister chromatid cohesion 1 protein 3 [Vitis vinifera]|uniref:Sister chromatid cohesion 1 protein 3 n=1 Tax=Vitis vinifera TaxID=29760 RepID=A0A438J1N6_VITVI|nr:Sister chromatid cohesion 1 protein 3 [Vitis vinifera]